MSTERERRKAAKRERDKAARARAAADRRERLAAAARAERVRLAAQDPGRDAAPAAERVSASAAARWPVAEAWISETWEDAAATVHGVLIRGPGANDAHAAAAFTFHPTHGLQGPVVRIGASLNACRQLLVERAEGTAMLACTPEDLAALLRKARRAAGRQPLPEGHSELSELLADLDPDDALLDVDVDHSLDEDTEEQPHALGVWGRLKMWFGGE